jgi:predicted  nucleic acid-binding Zn-ribbon protein
MDAKDADLAKVRAELEAERRARTNAEQLRGQLKDAQADVKSFKRRLGVAKEDVAKARNERNEARKISYAFQILQEKQRKRSAEWKQIQTRLTVDVESTTAKNA